MSNKTDIAQEAAQKKADETNVAEPTVTDESEESLLGKLQADLDRFRDLALRSEADMQNFRKRAAREKEDAIKFANASFLERLIPVLDNFEMGLTAARAEKNSAILAGLEMVAKQFQDFLTDSGVQAIDATAQKFDPNLHEAISQEASTEVEEGHVVRQLRKGYKLKERLLRPANVIVSKGKAA
jgi:molecular chaperone GrpE